ncbi:MAG: hypothetical protein MHM6MM_005713, partial [Cercozoa sp. M6MM]
RWRRFAQRLAPLGAFVEAFVAANDDACDEALMAFSLWTELRDCVPSDLLLPSLSDFPESQGDRCRLSRVPLAWAQRLRLGVRHRELVVVRSLHARVVSASTCDAAVSR